MRIKCLLLAVLMILTSFNITVFAAEMENSVSLDDIAWENLTYRDIFIENNLAYLDGFNGRDWGAFVKNAGNSTITNEDFYTAPYSLKAFGSPSQQIVSSATSKAGDYFVASKVYCTRYVKGELGVCLQNTTVGVTNLTDDFVTACEIVTLASSYRIYVGSIHSADLDGYVDDTVVVNMNIFENAPTENELKVLYENYVEIEKTRDRSEVIYTKQQALDAFMEYLCKKAETIGMESSVFGDPVGNSCNLVTAEDTLKLLIYAYNEYDELEEIWSNQSFEITVGGKKARKQTVVSTVIKPELEDYYHILGGKTGTLGTTRNLAVVLEIPESEDKLAVVALCANGNNGEEGNRYQAVKEIAGAALLKYNNPDYDNSSMDVCCKSAIACVIPSGKEKPLNHEILYSKDINTQRYPASITKVLTAICAIDIFENLESEIIYDKFDINTSPWYANDFYHGDTMTLKDTLCALLLPSSDVTAFTVARSAGEKILESKEKNQEQIIWEQGTIASVDGNNKTGASRFRTADYLLLESYSGVGINSGYEMTNFVYDAEYNYLGTSSWVGEGIPFTTAELMEKYPSGVYFRVVFRAVDQRNLTENDVTASGVKFYLKGEEVPEPDFGFTFENLGSIGTWQDGDIHDGKLFVFGAAGTGAVFDLDSLEKLGGITLDKKDVIKPHANSVCFGNKYYEEGDKYPLLYINIYNNYANADDRMEGTCCVYRVLEEDGVFGTELVQVIKIGFTEDLNLWKSKENNGDVRPYGNFVVDTDKNSLYAFVMRDANKTTRFFEFDIPEIGAGTFNENYGCNVLILETADIKNRFDSEYYNYLQGCCYYGGKILYMGDFGGDAPLYLMDLEKQKITDNFNLGHAGLRAEPEVICVDDSDGSLYYCAADGILRKIELSVELKQFTELFNGFSTTDFFLKSGVLSDGNEYVVPIYSNTNNARMAIIPMSDGSTYHIKIKNNDKAATYRMKLCTFAEPFRRFSIAKLASERNMSALDPLLTSCAQDIIYWDTNIGETCVSEYEGTFVNKNNAKTMVLFTAWGADPSLVEVSVRSEDHSADDAMKDPMNEMIDILTANLDAENQATKDIMQIACGFWEHRDEFIYCSGTALDRPWDYWSYTGYVDSANTGKTVTEENSGYKRIDCSTFVRYVVNGIDYYSTPYYNALENTDVEQGGLEDGKEVPCDDVTVCRTDKLYIREGKKLILESKNSNYYFTKIFGYDKDGKVVQILESPDANKSFVPDEGVAYLRVEMKVNSKSDYAPASEVTPAAILKCLRIREDERLEINAEVPLSGHRNANEMCRWFDENGYAVEIDKENFNPDDLRVGSIVFWGRTSGSWAYKNITHTSLYIGDGYIIHVSAPYGLLGGEGILIEKIDTLIKRYDLSFVAISSPEYHGAESASNPCGPSAFWKIEDGVLKISGTGEIYDYETTNEIPWYENRDEITAIEIDEGITAIGKRNFTGLENLVSVTLPESLEKIGAYAFWNCSSLYDIVLPENLNEIGAGAFFGCSALDYIVIPCGVTVLEQSVFAQCEKLDTVVLHDDIIEIRKEAFSRCYGLLHFGMPLNLETIGYHAFFGCANLQQLTFAENISRIEDAAFYGCTNLSVLRFSGNSPEFSEKAFLDITADVFYPLGDESWDEAINQNYGGTISWYSECYHNYKEEITEPTCTVEGYTTHICTICGDSYVDTYTEPTGHSFGEWETVKEATFTEDGTESRTCVKCSHVEFRSVPLTVIASGNFGYGTTPTDKVIYTIYSNGTMTVEGEGAIYGCYWDGRYQPFIEYREQIKHLIIGEGITQTTGGCFAYLTNLETVEFPSTLTKLLTNAFMGSFSDSVKKIVIPESVTHIGSFVFGYYSGSGTYFEEAVFENPDIIFTDDTRVFNGGKKYDKLTVYSYGKDNNVSRFADKAGCQYIDLNNYKIGEFGEIKYIYSSGVLTLSTDSEGVLIPSENAPWHEHRNEVTKIVIGEGITGISENAFVNYPALEEVALPDSFKIIGNSAFAVTDGRSVSMAITIPRRIETLGKDIFNGRENVNVTAYYGTIAEKISESNVNLELKKVFKILFIGNSYTEDATCCGQGMKDSQLFNAMQAMLGEDAEVVLGVIVSGGKGIHWHATQADRGNKSYNLRTMSSENKTWKSHGAVTSMDALEFTDWDAVSLQVYNVNVNTGEESVPYPEQTDPKFYKLEAASEFMLDLFAEYAPYADAYFYMHWGQTSSTAINAALSGYNKMADYIPVVLDYAGTESGKRFENIVPVGLSIQNARTTYLALLRYNTTAYNDGNLNLVTDAQIGLQRDGGHVSFNIGRYIAGLTFAEMVIPEEMREEGYVLPDIRITESVGKLPAEYTEIAQKSVFAAVESWKNGSLAVTEIEGYKVDPVDTESAKLAETKIKIPYTADEESLKDRIKEAVLESLPEDFNMESVVLAEDFEIIGEGQEFEAEIEIRFGYMSKKVNVSFAIEKALYGDINLDGKVDVMDAYYVRLVVAKLRKPTEQQILLGDVDLDGKITAIDANIIRKFAVKMIAELPVK